MKERMNETMAYVVTSRRRSGPNLAKSYGDKDVLFLYLTLEDAKAQLGRIPQEDHKYWMILPVFIYSNEEAWEAMANEEVAE
jgi:hypothetical protein